MSRRKNGVRKDRVAKLDEINAIDKKLKRSRIEEKTDKLMARRNALRARLKQD
tara:strand:- start:941 stop:1099 length:159 start_codon:yes stop_codon:yes gene_type:complete